MMLMIFYAKLLVCEDEPSQIFPQFEILGSFTDASDDVLADTRAIEAESH